MYTTRPVRTAASLLLAVTLFAGVSTLTGCQTPQSSAPAPSPTPADPGAAAPESRPATVPPDLAGLPADRVERELQRRAAEAAEASERYAGVPADRVEERLARESAR